MDRSFGNAASSGTSSPSFERTSFTSSRVASFASISASRSSVASHAAMMPSFPDVLWKIDFKTDGGSVDDVSDDARARSS
jgi:hypothetical protein